MNDACQRSRARSKRLHSPLTAWAAPWFCLVVALTLTGCGANGSVSGKVSYKGEPVGGGTVLFVPQGQQSLSARINADGTYSIEKIAAGPVKISVETKTAQQVKGPPRGMPTPPPGAIPKDAPSIYNQPSQPQGKYVPIPENYADPDKSELTYTVIGGSQTHNIDLK
jgi:hypothetical protein